MHNASIRMGAMCAALAFAGPLPAQDRAREIDAQPRVDSIFARFERRDAPGCAVGVGRAGTSIYARGYGMADLENDIAIAPNTAFYLASVSKQITAYSILLLAHDGKLSLDDDVRKFFPELHDFAAANGKPITVRHLVNHTSGLRDYFALLALSGWPGDGPVTEQDFLRLMGKQRTLNFAPGSRHLYSNSGYVLLAMLVKRASDKTFREFAAERIFQPLGMTNTVVRDDHNVLVKRRAPAYVSAAAASGGWRLSIPGFDVVGDGGIYSTVEDLAKWTAHLESPRAADSAAVAQITQRGILASGDTISYAAGVAVGRFRGLPTVSHGGAYGGYRTNVLRFPDQRLAVTVLCNNGTANTTQLAQRVAEVYLGDVMAPVVAQASRDAAPVVAAPADNDLLVHAGTYWNEETEASFRIVHAPGKLTLAGLGPQIELRHVEGRQFDAPAFALKVEFLDRGAQVTGGDGRPILYVRVATAAAPSAAELQALVATYTSDEAEATVDVRVRDGTLEVTGRRLTPIPLTHVFGDTFAGGPAIVRFVRKGKTVTGLTISSGRSRGVAFARR